MTPFPTAPASRWSPALRVGLALGLLLLVVGEALLLLSPRSLTYALTADTLQIEARTGPWDQGRAVPRAELGEAAVVTLTEGRKQRGSDFPDLCVGWWWQKGIGEVWQGTTCGAHAVRIASSDGRPLVLSPADPEAFLTALRDGASGRFGATPAPPGGGWFVWVVGVSLAVGAAVAGLLLLPIHRIGLAVGDGHLAVSAVGRTWRLPMAGATVEARAVGRPAWRMVGIGLPGFHLGLYRIDGQNVRVALTDRARGVWVRPAVGAPWVVTPADPDAFVAALRDQGAAPA